MLSLVVTCLCFPHVAGHSLDMHDIGASGSQPPSLLRREQHDVAPGMVADEAGLLRGEKSDLENASFTSFKPECLYINLASRQDRKLRLEGELAKAGLSCNRMDAVAKAGVVATKLVKKHGSGWEACRQSHVKALDLIAASKADYGLIFEDDAVWDQNMSVVHDVLSHAEESIKKYPVILLSCQNCSLHSGNVWPADEPWMRKIKTCQTTTAYIIRKDYIPTLRNLWVKGSLWDPFFRDEWKVPIDIQWMKMQLKDHWGLTQPSLVNQSKGYSDIDHKVKNLVETETRGDSASIP